MKKLYLKILMILFPSVLFAQGNQYIKLGDLGRTLGTNKENLETSYFKVKNFGFFGSSISEQHGAWYYPTPNDYHEPGYFQFTANMSSYADFNGDGFEDILIIWTIFPHTIERESRFSFSIFLNDGKGGLTYAPEIFESLPTRFFPFKITIEDFNMDGRPDFVAASMGMVKRNPDFTFTNKWEPIPLVLSRPDGKLYDASANIEGQENGGLPQNFSFGHDLSTGDVNKDGFPDIYTGGCLFINDGTGKFKNVTSQLPIEMRADKTFLMHSLIGDLDGDEIGDLVAAYADGAENNKSGFILLSQGEIDFSKRKLIELPSGMYGAGKTKFNHGVLYDVDGDKRLDLVFSTTRANPYYVGRGLQVIMNQGNGVFTDETEKRVISVLSMDKAHGAGQLYISDANNDGILDLIHSMGTAGEGNPDVHSIVVYNNSGGVLKVQSFDDFPFVARWQIDGYEEYKPFNNFKMEKAFPINLDNKNGIDFFATVKTPLSTWPQNEPNELSFYLIESTKAFTIVDGNKIPSISSQTFSVKENSANGKEIGEILANDGDGDKLTYSITSGNSGDAFELDPATGKLKLKTATAIRNKTSLVLKVAVNDGLYYSHADINVTIIPNGKPNISAQNFSINENSPVNSEVGTIQASDPDTDNLTFKVTAGNTNNAFKIGESTGKLSINNAAAIDFEINSEFNLTITVSDGLDESSANVKIILIDIDDTPPVVKIKNITVALNADGKAALKAEDVDNGTSDNEKLESISLSQTNFTCSDLGAKKITFTAKDAAGNSASAEVTITIVDNLKPTIKTKSNYLIKLDAEGKATLKWQDIDDGSSDNCSISERTLSKTEFTRANAGENTIVYTIKDASGNTSTAEIKVTVDIILSTPFYKEEERQGIQLYPNPAQNSLVIDFEKSVDQEISSIEIIDASGRGISEVRILETTNNSLRIDTSYLKNGVYYLRISTPKSLRVLKFIIEK
jgi:hypothetical protein